MLAAVDAECCSVRQKPSWVKQDRREQTIAGTSEMSSYQEDFCSLFSGSTAPAETLAPATNTTSLMRGTTRSLFAGTPKATMQLPGYLGHIPVNVRNETKYRHSYGEQPRPPQYDLRLTRPNLGFVPGYSGMVLDVIRMKDFTFVYIYACLFRCRFHSLCRGNYELHEKALVIESLIYIIKINIGYVILRQLELFPCCL